MGTARILARASLQRLWLARLSRSSFVAAAIVVVIVAVLVIVVVVVLWPTKLACREGQCRGRIRAARARGCSCCHVCRCARRVRALVCLLSSVMLYLEITRRAPTLQEGQGASGAQPPALPIVLKQRARNAARDIVCGRARGGGRRSAHCRHCLVVAIVVVVAIVQWATVANLTGILHCLTQIVKYSN